MKLWKCRSPAQAALPAELGSLGGDRGRRRADVRRRQAGGTGRDGRRVVPDETAGGWCRTRRQAGGAGRDGRRVVPDEKVALPPRSRLIVNSRPIGLESLG